jgi:hypothetical protein
MNADERKIFLSGTSASIAAIVAFCQISTQSIDLSFNGHTQYLFIISIILFFFAKEHKKIFSNLKISKGLLLIFGLFVASSLSILNTADTLTSAKRLTMIFSVALITFLIANCTINPKKLLLGVSTGITTVTAISVLYSLVAAAIDFNFINQQPYELVAINIFGLEIQQTIAHRAYIYDGSTYYIQRYAGIFPNPNGLGLMSAISFALSSLFISGKKIKYTLQTLFIIGLFLSLSRMGLLLFTASFIYYTVNNTVIRRVTCAAMITGLFSFLFFTVSSEVSTELTSHYNSLGNQELFQLRDRAHLMSQAWLGFLENWPLGVGFGVGAEYLFPDNADTLAVHSVFINTALETGILGITFLLAIWLLPIFATKSRRDANNNTAHERDIIAAILFGLFFAEAFDLSVMRFHYIHLIFFFLLGTWSAMGRTSKDTALNNV